jgi:hypothetical protein
MTQAYPLTWPATMPRCKVREKGQFRTQLTSALGNVRTSLHLFGNDSGKPVQSVVISSNVTLGETKPQDPGVAVWFTWDGLQVCIPVDRYLTVESNLQAIHHVLEARRVELRHGTLALVRATFTGFAALPAPAGNRPWRTVFGTPSPNTVEELSAAYRILAKSCHPNAPGGSEAKMAELNVARDEALKEIGS